MACGSLAALQKFLIIDKAQPSRESVEWIGWSHVGLAMLGVIAVAVVLMIALTLYIKHSRMGRASRACAQDMHMASMLGINTNRVISFTFVLGAILAAVGGVLNVNTLAKKTTALIGEGATVQELGRDQAAISEMEAFFREVMA